MENMIGLGLTPFRCRFLKYMKTIVATLVIALSAIATLFAEDAQTLRLFRIPVPPGFSEAATEKKKQAGVDLKAILLAQGIRFPDGAKIELDAKQNILEVRLTHQEALHLIQIINLCMDESGEDKTKRIFALPPYDKHPEPFLPQKAPSK